ncbi:unnamed protein product [Rhodiola kirilowii]
MDALIASYGDDTGSDSESDSVAAAATSNTTLPPPPLELLSPLNSSIAECLQKDRVRSFEHVEGNYALHVFIPVFIPSTAKKGLCQLLKKLVSTVPDLNVVDVDLPLGILCKDDEQLEQIALSREFHISLGRTVPIRVHQINSIVTMLRQRLQFQRRYWIEFSSLEVFVNDDNTRTFISLEVTAAGLFEIKKQIQAVNEVYKLHSLPEYYKDPRPHISLAWASGDISQSLKRAVDYETKMKPMSGGSLGKPIFGCKFEGIECKIGKKTHTICKCPDEY